MNVVPGRTFCSVTRQHPVMPAVGCSPPPDFLRLVDLFFERTCHDSSRPDDHRFDHSRRCGLCWPAKPDDLIVVPVRGLVVASGPVVGPCGVFTLHTHAAGWWPMRPRPAAFFFAVCRTGVGVLLCVRESHASCQLGAGSGAAAGFGGGWSGRPSIGCGMLRAGSQAHCGRSCPKMTGWVLDEGAVVAWRARLACGVSCRVAGHADSGAAGQFPGSRAWARCARAGRRVSRWSI